MFYFREEITKWSFRHWPWMEAHFRGNVDEWGMPVVYDDHKQADVK